MKTHSRFLIYVYILDSRTKHGDRKCPNIIVYYYYLYFCQGQMKFLSAKKKMNIMFT